MITEIKRGRLCNELQARQAVEIETQGKLLLVKDRALQLSQSITEAKESEVKELREALSKTKEATVLREKKARKRGRIEGVTVSAVLVVIALVL